MARSRDANPDLLIRSHTLYPLSYERRSLVCMPVRLLQGLLDGQLQAANGPRVSLGESPGGEVELGVHLSTAREGGRADPPAAGGSRGQVRRRKPGSVMPAACQRVTRRRAAEVEYV